MPGRVNVLSSGMPSAGRVVTGTVTLSDNNQYLTIPNVEGQPDIICAYASNIDTYPTPDNPSIEDYQRTSAMIILRKGKRYSFGSVNDNQIGNAIGCNMMYANGYKANMISNQLASSGVVNANKEIRLTTYSNATVWKAGTYNYILVYMT